MSGSPEWLSVENGAMMPVQSAKKWLKNIQNAKIVDLLLKRQTLISPWELKFRISVAQFG